MFGLTLLLLGVIFATWGLLDPWYHWSGPAITALGATMTLCALLVL